MFHIENFFGVSFSIKQFLFVITKERDTFQRQHIFVIVCHLVVVLLPHVDEVITINQTNELTRAGAGITSIGRKCTTCHEQGNIACTEYAFPASLTVVKPLQP